MKNINEMTKMNKNKSEKVLKEPFCFFVWIFKVELIILAIFFVIGNIFNSISDKTKFVMKYNIEKSLYSDIENKEYYYKEVLLALEANKHIENEEKEFIGNILK